MGAVPHAPPLDTDSGGEAGWGMGRERTGSVRLLAPQRTRCSVMAYPRTPVCSSVPCVRPPAWPLCGRAPRTVR
eukprot:scaffold53900_cov72-Phaeocystis_antarctica.AAC.8